MLLSHPPHRCGNRGPQNPADGHKASGRQGQTWDPGTWHPNLRAPFVEPGRVGLLLLSTGYGPGLGGYLHARPHCSLLAGLRGKEKENTSQGCGKRNLIKTKYPDSLEEYLAHVNIQKTLALLFAIQGIPGLQGLSVPGSRGPVPAWTAGATPRALSAPGLVQRKLKHSWGHQLGDGKGKMVPTHTCENSLIKHPGERGETGMRAVQPQAPPGSGSWPPGPLQ